MPTSKTLEAARAYHPRGFECLCGNVRMASRALTSIYDRYLAPAGLNASQMAVLWCVVAREPVPKGAIARARVMDNSTVKRNVGMLMQMGLLETASGADVRRKLVSGTAKGRRTYAAALPRWEAAQEAVAKALGEAAFSHLVSGTKRASEVLQETP
ncbi:MAG: MarR family winged helix-turn-helix transcriptional regulator [Usitatibacter sp.]